MLAGRLQGEFVPISAETEQAAFRDVTEITIVPKLFPGERIAQVNFDKRNLHSEKRVAQDDAGMRESTRVQDDEFDSVDLACLATELKNSAAFLTSSSLNLFSIQLPYFSSSVRISCPSLGETYSMSTADPARISI